MGQVMARFCCRTDVILLAVHVDDQDRGLYSDLLNF